MDRSLVAPHAGQLTNARAGRVIDVHAHVTPQRFQKAVLSGSDWYGLTPADGELENLKNRWPPERRIEEMDRLGVDVQLLSPTDCFYQYHREPEVTAKIASECNDEVAEMVRDHPDRFMGLGTLPMQDVERTIEEMERATGELGLRGFMIDDHVNNLTYDHAVFDPFWSAAEHLRAFIFVHQGRPTSVSYRTQKFFLLNSVGNLVDRTLTFGCLVYGGVIDKYPRLMVCLAHAGGYVPYAVDRMDKGWQAFPAMRGASRDQPSTYLRRFFYDTVTYTDRNLRFLLDMVGSERVLFGTDWPAPMVVDDPVRRITTSAVLQDGERDAILRQNAATLLGAAQDSRLRGRT
ncbi:MAG: amidohydrolase [Chloroflexi bacterium]|nr:MAG: amidohydrolase [Chloroflexota bacterium]